MLVDAVVPADGAVGIFFSFFRMVMDLMDGLLIATSKMVTL